MTLLRVAILLAALAAATGVVWRRPGSRTAPLYVVDVSESMPAASGAAAGEEWIAFADGAKDVFAGEEAATLPRGATRIRLAIAAARELLASRGDAAAGRDVIVKSDGRATDAGALEEARALLASGHRLFTVPPDTPIADVAVDSARVIAADATPGEPAAAGVVVAVRLVASTSGRVRVSLRRDGRDVDVAEAPVVVGLSARSGAGATVLLRDAEPLRKATAYEVRLDPLDGTPDDDRLNDRVTLLATTDEPVVVLLDPATWPTQGGGTTPFRRLDDGLRDGDPVADALVVADVTRDTLSDEAAARLRRMVASGAVLVALGGANSFAAGGWRGTAFERLLPLRSRSPSDGEAAVVVALDRSGSTGETRAGASPALAALVRAVGALLHGVPDDVRVAVLPFASRADDAPLAPGWVRGRDADGRAALLASAAAIRAGGGTDLDEAITAAAAAASASDAKRRRVILLTDGDPDHELTASSFPRAREALARGGVALSAVVVGDARAADALRSLASAPEDVALVAAASAFPDALLAAFRRADARDEVVRAPARVTTLGDPGETAALARLEPSAAHRLEKAPDARLLATADVPGDAPLPFAAVRTVGAGAVVAVAWGPSLEKGEARADDARRTLVAFVRAWAARADRGFVGDAIDDRLVVLAPPGLGFLRAQRGQAVAPAGAGASTLLETGPGRYEGPALPDDDAAEPIVVSAPSLSPRPVRLAARPAAEHRGAGTDEPFLDALARAGGGRRLAPGAIPSDAVAGRDVSLGALLALVAVVLFLVERALALRTRRAGETPATAS